MATAWEDDIDILKLSDWRSMASQKPKKLPEKAIKSVCALFLSEGTNDDLLFMGGFYTWNICKCYGPLVFQIA